MSAYRRINDGKLQRNTILLNDVTSINNLRSLSARGLWVNEMRCKNGVYECGFPEAGATDDEKIKGESLLDEFLLYLGGERVEADVGGKWFLLRCFGCHAVFVIGLNMRTICLRASNFVASFLF